MEIFDRMQQLRYGSLHLHTDEATGLRAVVAVHNTRLGPGIGGCRCIPYATSDAAITDAMRLARGMSYKAAISGLPHGGAKAVIMLDAERRYDREALFTAYGRFVDSIGGDYITCEDSGTSTSDMDIVATQTRHVLGTSAGSGDPSPFTALGVRRGIEAAVKFQLGRDDLDGLHIAVQGVGHVGYHLVKEVVALGARVTVADINADNVQRCIDDFGVNAVSTDDILAVECDVLAPCALGAVFNDDTIPALNTKIVAGASNNVLAEDRHGVELFKRGILYAPDYAINAGGLINVAIEYSPGGYDAAKATEQVTGLYDALWAIFERAKSEDTPTHIVADRIVEERIFD